MMVGAVPGGSFGRVGSRRTVWQLWMVVAMVAAAEGAPEIEYFRLKGGQVPWTILGWEGFTYKAGSGWWESARLFDHVGV